MDYLEGILAEDLVQEVQDFVLHAGDSIIVIWALRVELLHHAVHGCAFPEWVAFGPRLIAQTNH